LDERGVSNGCGGGDDMEDNIDFDIIDK